MEHPLSQFKYCPKCGSAHFEVHNEKSKQCADCGFVYYFNPSSATVALILNARRATGVPPRQRACQRDAGPPRRLHRHDRDRRGRRCPRSKRRNRHEGGKGRISLLPAQYLHLFRLPRTHAGYVFPLYGGGHLALQGDGRRGRPLLPPLERYPYGRVRARLHPQRSGYLPGRHAEEQKRMIIRSYYGIYPKKAKQV